MQRAVIIHGWSGSPKEGWIPWLKRELEPKGFEVAAPSMPSADTPTQEEWVSALSDVIGQPDENLYLVGHSLGCITILRYLETLRGESCIGGALLVAGFCKDLSHEGYSGELATFFSTPILWNQIKRRCEKFVVINSDNDPWVPTQNHELLVEGLNAADSSMEHNMSHFSGDDGITELPLALEKVLSMTH